MISLRLRYPIIAVLLLYIFPLMAEKNNYLYVYFNSEDGLSQDEVTSITQDNNGLMWFATRGGLNSFDGHQFKTIRPIFNQEQSLISSSIERIFTDHKGRIWIGYKKGGVSIYHPNSKWLENIYIESFQNDGRVISFSEDKQGRIYIGQWESGITVYDYDNDIQTHILGNHKIAAIKNGEDNTIWAVTNNGLVSINTNNLSYKWIGKLRNEMTCLEVDTARNCLWIGYWGNALIEYNYEEDIVIEHRQVNDEIKNIYAILSMDNNSLLVGSWGDGLYLFDKATNSYKTINIGAQSYTNTPFAFQGILDLYKDKQDNIWIGTNGDGIVMQKQRKNLTQYKILDNSLIEKPVSQVIQTRDNTYFLASESYGIAYSKDLEHFKWIVTQTSSRINCLYPLSDNKILFGTNDKNLNYINKEKNTYKIVELEPTKENRFQVRKLTTAIQGKTADTHWLGTQQRGLVLAHIDTGNNEINILKRFHPKHLKKKYRLSDSRVSELVSDSVLWIGTYGGLDYYNYAKDSIIHFSNEHLVGRLSDRIILSFSIDNKGQIWCGTPSGLNKIYHDKGLWKIQYYGIKEGLPNAYITSVVHDSNHMLWVSTNQGLAVYDPDSDRFNSYIKGQMSGRLRFLDNAHTINNNGEAVFGGLGGITICRDDFSSFSDVDDNSLYISSIKLSGVELQDHVKIDGKRYKVSNINKLEKLNTSSKTKQIEINVSTLDFVNLGSIRYEYLLAENTPKAKDNKDWRLMGNDGKLRFDNLTSGNYTLKIRAINIFDNSLGKERQLKLIIPPPAYRSWWAFSIYITLIITVISLIFYMLRLQHNARLESLKRSQQEDLHKIQSQAFVNISHEFKTPLTIISAYIKELLIKKDEHCFDMSVIKKLNSIAMSSQRMNDMIIDLATFRKSEQKGLALQPGYIHLPSFIKQVTRPFCEIIDLSDGKLKVSHDKGSQHLIIDGEKLQILLNNLLSNALKFSPKTPIIQLYLSAYNNRLTIKVKDNGIGIPSDKIDKIFDRFYRISNHTSGSGIGLSLVKQIVDIQNGTIEVESKEREGTCFTVTLPYEEANEEMISQSNDEEEFIPEKANDNTTSKVVSKDKPQILIVEDKPQMMQLMENILNNDFSIFKATNGTEGYKQAMLIKPKLIISDIAMPYSDGVQLLKKIRENKDLKSIPVLIVTGNDDQQTIINCFENGADDVLKKPFDPILFKTKVEALLQMRKHLKEAYSQKILLSSSKEEVSPKQAIFITKLMAIIEKNVNNPQLGLPFLAEQCSLSSSGLYRKVKTTTGKTVVELIRSVKIDTACTLLRDTERNIEDISFEAGFSDVRYFQKCFKEEQGISAGEYRKKYR